jgi:hypothetical protein
MTDGAILSFESFFERMWLLYPDIRKRGDKGKAREQLIIKLKNGEKYENIGRGIAKFRKYCEATGEKQPDMFRWLRDAGYNQDYTIAAANQHQARTESGGAGGAEKEQRARDALRRSAEKLGLLD